MSINAKVDIRAFTYEILHNLNMYQSPMDFWVMPTGTASLELKRLDKRSIIPLENSINIKERLDSNDCITFRDIIGVSLHLDAYRKSQQYSAYFKWLDTYHNVQDEKCESIFLHTYNNVTLYLLAIRRLWNNVLYIPRIEEYLIKNTEFLFEGTIDINCQDICNFTFSLYSEILSLFCRQETVSTDDVNQISERLLSSRYYSDVYLFITGYIYEKWFDESKPVSTEETHYGELKEKYKWDFSLLQQRITPKFYLSDEDKKNFAYCSDYIAALDREIKKLSETVSLEETQLSDDQKEALDSELNHKQNKYELVIAGKKAVERYRNETKAYR